MRELRADVVVAGGGPGGATTATLLAKAGHHVILLERDHHPRHQIGESLLPSTIHGVCRLLDVWDDVHAAGFVKKRGSYLRWGRSPEPWAIDFSHTLGDAAGYAFQVERARFDTILFENAVRHGVDARQGVEITELIRDGERATGVIARDADGKPFAVRAPYVVDASGNGSRLARNVGSRVYSEFFRNVAVYGYFTGAGRLPEPYSGNIITAAFEQGWCWFIPLTTDAALTSVGAVVDRQHAKRIGEDREAALMEFTAKCPIISDQLAGARRIDDGMYGQVRVRKDWSYMTDRLHGDGMLLVGDAGCFIDPVFSSGVHLATYGGTLAARTINTALAGDIDEAACLREFERRYRREFGVWYDFLLGFFDLQQDADGYFWKARSVLGTDERANDAFIRLIAGGSTAPGDFFAERVGIGAEFESMIPAIADRTGDAQPAGHADPGASTRLNDERTRESRHLIRGGSAAPLFEDGLVPSEDGMRWARPPVPAPSVG